MGWIHRSGLPISAARWTMPGSSSTGLPSGISATRTMPPARKAARSMRNTPRSTMPGLSVLPPQSTIVASAGRSIVPLATIAPSRTSRLPSRTPPVGQARRALMKPITLMPSPPPCGRGG
ncbi:hypothetical protein WR25_01005 [Diploscapter pachys]|uniref:Uncharacterized protein n=1 Tax=Diploscapter pachys TaxID=2018661 RepID=A0A2A2M5G3_9BILA|nr:hypothetical protein WR25_01005 [Diploscapter pachys]